MQDKISDGNLEINAPERLKSMKTIRTMPFPGFPTDAQAPLLATACVADGTTVLLKIYLKTDTDTSPNLSEWVQPLRQRAR